MLTALALDIPPDPVGIARRLADAGRSRIALLHAADPTGDFGRFSYVAADPDRASEAIDPLVDDPDFQGATGALASVPRWIGVLPYEHFRDLERPAWSSPETRAAPLVERPIWHRYPAVVAIDHREGRVLVAGTDRGAIQALAELARRPPPARSEPLSLHVHDAEPTLVHAARISAARELIFAGDLYQVNLARRLAVELRGGDALGLYAALGRRAPTPFGAYLELDTDRRVLSTSPELLLAASVSASNSSRGAFDRLVTAPIKGTRPRGRDAGEDHARVLDLDRDPKEIAELSMIVDVVRNDLGKVAQTGSVRLARPPHVVTHRTIHHRLALLVARAKPELARVDILRSLVPSGSVTGAPKVRAMEVIASLEGHRRGLYTGGIGFVAQDGSMLLSMAIRTVVLRGREGEYLTGGGIVADSDPGREVEETRWKALQLEAAARG
ncbi:MAG: anthranilate synthase component I family protein [Byssovorax sp.]